METAEHGEFEVAEWSWDEEDVPSDEGGLEVEVTGRMNADGGKADAAEFGWGCENEILDAISAERRLCASFSLAWFTRLTTWRIAWPAFLTAASRPSSP